MDTGYNVYVERLTELIQQKEFGQALDYLETIPAAERNYWEILNLTGILCSYCQEYDSAISFFRKALQKYPDLTDIYYNLADAYLNKGEYQQADVMLTACMQLLDDEEMLAELKEVKEQIAKECEKKTNSVLMIAYYYPPLSGSGVFRSLKFSKYLPEMHWKPTVISTDVPPTEWNFSDESMLEEIPKGVDVIRIADMITSGRDTGLSAQEVNELVRYLFYVMAKDKEAIDLMSAYLKDESKLPKLMSFPCSCLKWSWKVIQYIEQNMNLNDFDVIYTTSGPASAHLVGYYLKKKYGIPWVADYRDPWTGNAYSKFDYNNPSQRLIYKMENILLHQADFNLTCGKSGEEDYLNRFQLPQEKIATITNGYDDEDFRALDVPKCTTDRFTITYSGLLYLEPQRRGMSAILKATRELIEEGHIKEEKICFRMVGSGNEAGNEQLASLYGLENCFEQTGYVFHKKALQENRLADLLLLLIGDDEQQKGVHSGKFFEQLRSGKPILAIAPSGGEVEEILRETGHGKAFLSTQVDKIKQMILEEYQKWVRNENECLECSPFIKVFERKYLTTKLAEILYRVSNNRKKTEILVIGSKDDSKVCLKTLKERQVDFCLCNSLFEKDNKEFPLFELDEIKEYQYQSIVITCKQGAQFIKDILMSDYGVSESQILIFWNMYYSQLPSMILDKVMRNPEGGSYEGIILGLSHAEAAIVTERLEAAFCNLATSSQDLYYQLTSLKYCIKNYPNKIKNLKYAIIDLYDYNYFNYDASLTPSIVNVIWNGGPDIDGHNFAENKHYNCTYEELVKELSIRKFGKISRENLEVWKKYFERVYLDNAYEGFEPRYRIGERFKMVTEREIDEYEYSRSVVTKIFPDTIEENKKIFSEIIETLLTLNPAMQIYTVIFPKYAEVESRDEEHLSKHKEYYNEIIREFQNRYSFIHIDLKEVSNISAQKKYYYDADHLNYYGACKTTDIINKMIFGNN